MSILMLCFATVDRYCSTSRDVRRRNWSSLKVTKISILIALIVSFSFPIPDFFYVGIKQGHCGYISIGYDKYFTYFVAPVLLAIFPVSILSIFGFLTRRNLRKCTATAQKTAAQRINHELSRMLLMQIVWFLISTLTLFGVKLYSTIVLNRRQATETTAIESLIQSIAFLFYRSYQSGSFYVYVLTSATYRSGLKKILREIYRRISRTAST
ncbi:unnamed protein product [Rotaria sp. Silwood1]|nr:unnamed protein product [Rotaria sp. Silwood1]